MRIIDTHTRYRRRHIRSSQSALHSRNTFGTTITLHPRFPLFFGHSIFLRFILFIFISTIRGHIYDGPPRRHRRHRVVVRSSSIPLNFSSYFYSSRVAARKIDIIIPDVPFYVLCVTPINIEQTALRPYKGRRPSFSI